MAIVVLDILKFRAMFPEFDGLTDAQITLLFELSTDYLDNTNYSLVIDPLKRERLLYLLMSHLAYMRFGDAAGNGGTGMVGRLSSASEGSASASFDLGAMSAGSTWFTQSPYGMDFWQATKVYRMATYYPGSPYG